MDVKCSNLLIQQRDFVVLADFGAARWAAEADDAAPPRGTPAWMAPETACGRAPAAAADVWGVGCVVVEMCTGRPPFASRQFATDWAIVHFLSKNCASPDIPRDLPAEGADLLTLCFVHDPLARLPCSQLLQHPFLQETPPDSCATE
eukprot:TRINITY_DN9324_c0_g1_i1.p1 TRINITY_DN9324_c0_g1~~TRINITY_DN9324_c0_g1_i1.p1  ORF type:complete len:147 (+),score=13.80 TRINITY_DN9324_c0_g1_i1:306-746(+)